MYTIHIHNYKQPLIQKVYLKFCYVKLCKRLHLANFDITISPLQIRHDIYRPISLSTVATIALQNKDFYFDSAVRARPSTTFLAVRRSWNLCGSVSAGGFVRRSHTSDSPRTSTAVVNAAARRRQHTLWRSLAQQQQPSPAGLAQWCWYAAYCPRPYSPPIINFT